MTALVRLRQLRARRQDCARHNSYRPKNELKSRVWEVVARASLTRENSRKWEVPKSTVPVR